MLLAFFLIFLLVSVAEETGLCLSVSETLKTVLSRYSAYDQVHYKNNKMACASIKNLDQPGLSQFRVCTGHVKKS